MGVVCEVLSPSLSRSQHYFVLDSRLCYWTSIALSQVVQIARKMPGGITGMALALLFPFQALYLGLSHAEEKIAV